MKEMLFASVCFFVILFQSCSYRYLGNGFKSNSADYIDRDTVLQKIQRKSKVLLIYNPGSARTWEKNYFMLSLQNEKWFAVSYKDQGIRSANYTTFTYEVVQIDKKKGDSVLKVFNKTRFWEINDNDNGCDELELMEAEKNSTIRCGRIHDAGKPILSMVVKNKASVKAYYAPEYFLCCRGFEDRKVFIACKNALLSTQRVK